MKRLGAPNMPETSLHLTAVQEVVVVSPHPDEVVGSYKRAVTMIAVQPVAVGDQPRLGLLLRHEKNKR